MRRVVAPAGLDCLDTWPVAAQDTPRAAWRDGIEYLIAEVIARASNTRSRLRPIGRRDNSQARGYAIAHHGRRRRKLGARGPQRSCCVGAFTTR